MSETGLTAVATSDVGVAEQALHDLLETAHSAAPHEIAGLIMTCARRLGTGGAVAYLADLQQSLLVPFVGPEVAADDERLPPLDVDATLAGRAFQTVSVQVQREGDTRVWVPLLNGTERLGVLAVTVADALVVDGVVGPLLDRLRHLASLSAELLVTKTFYGDTMVRLRRRGELGLAAEIQWSLLPPLTFVGHDVSVAAALEPAYQVAGDTVDYAVDPGCTRVAVFDAMGHGLHSAQLAVLAVAAYRNARRSGCSLIETAHRIDAALVCGAGADVFATALLAELDTDTGLLTWVNAGHPAPLLLRGGRLVKTLQVDPAAPLGLGLLDEGPPTAGAEQLEPGDQVLLYTDGVVEARSPNGDFFGVDRLADLVLRHLAGGLPAPESMRRVTRALLEHQGGRLRDDASLLLLKWTAGDDEILLP